MLELFFDGCCAFRKIRPLVPTDRPLLGINGWQVNSAVGASSVKICNFPGPGLISINNGARNLER